MLITTFGWRPSQSRADLYWICCFLVLLQRSMVLFFHFALHAHHCHHFQHFHSHGADSTTKHAFFFLRICEYEKRKWDTDAYALCTGVWCEWYNWIKESIYSLKFIGGWLFFRCLVPFTRNLSYFSVRSLYFSSLLLSCGAFVLCLCYL